MGWLGSVTDSVDMVLSKLQETVKDRAAWRAAQRVTESDMTDLASAQQQSQDQEGTHRPRIPVPT